MNVLGDVRSSETRKSRNTVTSSQPAQWNLLEVITLTRYRYTCVRAECGKGEGREGSRTEHLYMSHGNKIQPVRVENDMHNV